MVRVLSFDVGIVNLAYCILDYNEETKDAKIQHWEVITQENTKDQNKFHTDLIIILDRRPCLLIDIDIVLIEKQPSFNPKMRIVSGSLQTYFYIRGIVDRPANPIRLIRFISPKLKFNCYHGPEIVVTGKKKYSRTKKMGVEIASRKLQEYSEIPVHRSLFQTSS